MKKYPLPVYLEPIEREALDKIATNSHMAEFFYLEGVEDGLYYVRDPEKGNAKRSFKYALLDLFEGMAGGIFDWDVYGLVHYDLTTEEAFAFYNVMQQYWPGKMLYSQVLIHKAHLVGIEITAIDSDLAYNKQDSLFYGGALVRFKYRGMKGTVYAMGDVHASLFRKGKEVVTVYDKNNSGLFAREMADYITCDDEMQDEVERFYDTDGREGLEFDNNNWYELQITNEDGGYFITDNLEPIFDLDEACDFAWIKDFIDKWYNGGGE